MVQQEIDDGGVGKRGHRCWIAANSDTDDGEDA
jgi:hypothetical protein